MIDYLLSQLRDATSDVVRHGGCLGLGLAAMGTANNSVYEQLKHCLELDDAVTGYCCSLVLIFVKQGSHEPGKPSILMEFSELGKLLENSGNSVQP